jgi:hypothetical protein
MEFSCYLFQRICLTEILKSEIPIYFTFAANRKPSHSRGRNAYKSASREIIGGSAQTLSIWARVFANMVRLKP